MSQFDELLAQLNAAQEEQSTLAKALPEEGGEDDKTIQAASAEGAEGADKNPEDEEEEGGEPALTKSMTVDGEEVEIVDAGELIKSLEGLTGRVASQEELLVKGLTSALGMIKGQGDMIKSLQSQITKLSGQGAGRKAVLTVHDKPVVGEQPMAKSQPDQLSAGDVLAKANAAFDAKKISGHELTSIDVSLRQGVMPDAGLLAKCL